MLTFLGLEVGSWADWFSGIVTSAGIITSLIVAYRNGRLKFEIKASARGNYSLEYSVINHSGFDVKVQAIFISFRESCFKATEFNELMDKRLQVSDESDKVFKNNILWQEHLQLSTILEEERNKAKYNNGIIPEEQKRFNFDITKFNNHKSFYVVVLVLAQDGKFYKSFPKYMKLSDITFEKDFSI